MTKEQKNQYDRDYRERNRERLKEYEKSRSSRPERARDPYRMRARHALRDAVSHGRIKKPDTCVDCGWKGLLDGHHEDYSKPLSVIWLCRICHGKRHRTPKNRTMGSIPKERSGEEECI